MDMSIPYRGPDGLSVQLLSEVQARFGARGQSKGFVTGYMDAARAGQTGGHFADKHGITHAVDIGVDIEADGTGLLPTDALWLSEHLRALGAAGEHPFSRRGYLIHDLSTTTTPVPMIAGFHTGWKWVPYTGASPHSDHIHVTTGGDQQWGGEPQLTPTLYNSREPWGIGGAMKGMSPVPTGTTITQEFGTHPGGFNPSGGHTGRDYGAWTGTYAVSRAPGTVLWADWCHKLPGGANGWAQRWFFDLAFGGIIVVIQHDDGLITTYSHMWSTHLNPGDRVRYGEIVGETGNTGAATSGDHLHFEAMPANPNYASPTYGRIHPGPYITEPYTSITTSTGTVPVVVPQGTGAGEGATTKKDWLSMATKDELRAVIREEVKNADLGGGDKLGDYLTWHISKIRTGLDNVPAAVMNYEVPLQGLGKERGTVSNEASQVAWNYDRIEKVRRQVVAQGKELEAIGELVVKIAAALNIPTDTESEAA